MLSKRISTIGMFIVSEMTDNLRAKYRTLFGFESVVVSVAPNLAVLPRTFLENKKTRDNSFISLYKATKDEV